MPTGRATPACCSAVAWSSRQCVTRRKPGCRSKAAPEPPPTPFQKELLPRQHTATVNSRHLNTGAVGGGSGFKASATQTNTERLCPCLHSGRWCRASGRLTPKFRDKHRHRVPSSQFPLLPPDHRPRFQGFSYADLPLLLAGAYILDQGNIIMQMMLDHKIKTVESGGVTFH